MSCCFKPKVAPESLVRETKDRHHSRQKRRKNVFSELSYSLVITMVGAVYELWLCPVIGMFVTFCSQQTLRATQTQVRVSDFRYGQINLITESLCFFSVLKF